ncbi:MAG: HDOD domain-containing protein [Proteobacteria bacterium]|nr:HDOD domain-containing protein [Pseudomonadota bacterium]
MIANKRLDIHDWIAKLSAIDLPALQYTLDQMLNMQSKSDEISIRDIAQLIRHDPLLTLRIIRYQQSRRSAAQHTDVNTIDRVLLMIGLGGFFREFGKMDSIEKSLATNPEAQLRIRKLISRAYLAAVIADSLGGQRHDVDPIEVTTASLLHDLAEILLCLTAPELAEQISQNMKLNPGMRSNEAQKQVLGFTLNELQTELAQKWGLPNLLTHLMDERYIDEPRVRTVTIATSTARHLANGWQDPALPDDYQNIADLLSCDTDYAYSLIRNVSVKVAREWQWFAVLPVATGLPQHL